MKVTFIHPDLGIGGAERLIVDAAIALHRHGHQIKIVTNQYSKDHCFRETHDFDIVSKFQWIPRSICGRMMALCAYVKMILAAFYVCFMCESDIYIVDQVSACIPVLKWFSTGRVMFYCHFPDQLLTRRDTTLKAAYRLFLDWLEEWSTAKADILCVNSKFTASIVKKTFRRLRDRHLNILYPSLNTQFFDQFDPVETDTLQSGTKTVFLSLNRFERKKNVQLALEAYALLKSRLSSEHFASTSLIIAGGYDKFNDENIEYFDELQKKVALLALQTNVSFEKSPSDEKKLQLYRDATMVLYTPSNEHFGIVPVEAMYMETCVVAVNSGGPTESIEHGETGFLCDPTPESFADAMEQCISARPMIAEMGVAGRERVRKMFGMDAFADKLNNIILLE